MLVLEKTRSLALKLNSPERVLSAIPTAQTVTVRGANLVVTPHRVDEVRVLRNLGIDAPSPIMHYYEWPGRFKPYNHQQQTAAFLTLHPKALVLNEIGMGKTQSALWAADYLMRERTVGKVLILSPLSTLERVWADAIFMGFPERTATVLYGTADRRRKLLAQDTDFYIVNHDGFGIIRDHINGMFDLIIVDEAAVYRNHGSQRYKMLSKYMRQNTDTRLWLMTGTPTPNAPTDAWTLAHLVESPYIPRTFNFFRDQVMTKMSMYSYVPKPDSAEIVSYVLQPAVRFSRDECLDLPDTIFQTRQAMLTVEQKTHYDRMLRHLITEITTGGERITAVNEAVKLQKLVQIALGVAYGEDGQHIELDCAPRVQVTREVIEEAGGKVIVFVPLTGTLRMLERELAKHWSVAVVNGAVSSAKRNEIFYNFQNTTDPHVLIAHPATMAHGLTLTAASTVIWYGPITSNEQYTQANGRVERIGKRHVANVVNIEASALERKMFKRLQDKQALQGLLLELVQQGMKI